MQSCAQHKLWKSNFIIIIIPKIYQGHLPWTRRERIESFLDISLIALKPAIRSVVFNIFSPNRLVAVNRVAGNANNSTCRNILTDNS